MTKAKEQNNQPKGLILGNTTDEEGKLFELPKYENVFIRIKPTKRKDIKAAYKRYTVKKFDNKSHQPYDDIDIEKATKETERILRACIKGWKGIYRKNEQGEIEELQYNPENLDWFLENYIDLQVGTKQDKDGEEVKVTIDEWIMNISAGPENFIENDTENL